MLDNAPFPVGTTGVVGAENPGGRLALANREPPDRQAPAGRLQREPGGLIYKKFRQALESFRGDRARRRPRPIGRNGLPRDTLTQAENVIFTLTVGQLAELVQGELLGAPDLAVSNARPIPDAQPGDITFADDEQLEAWRHCPAAAAVVPLTAERSRRPVIRVPDPLTAFARIVQAFRGRPAARVGGLHPTAVIDPTARLGGGVSVGPHAVVGERAEVGANTRLHAGVVVGRGCRLGADVVLHPHVVLYDDCVLGDRVVVHANAVLGADGFGYRLRDGRHERVPHVGWVEVEEDVEIGAGSTIDRGTFGPTRVGAGTKIDNLVMVAHNCRVGRHNILAGQVGLGGSTATGEFVVMAGQAGTVDHVHIGDRAVVGARAAVLGDVPAGGRVLGYPARPAGSVKRAWATFEHLPAMRKDLKRIKDRLDMTDADPGPA